MSSPTWKLEFEFLTGEMAESAQRFTAERDLLTEEMRIVIGRAVDADLTISDNTVSRRHCAVQLTPEGPVLKDLGSSGGTYVNGERITEKLLSPGDKFIVGANLMVLLIRSDVG